MIVINEWLPNPAGSDAAGEWVELFNSGENMVMLSGWRILTQNQKEFTLREGIIPPQGYLVLERGVTKLTLNNTEGGLGLYDASGHLVDQASFRGTAPMAKSVNRLGQGFVFAEPTPGRANDGTALALLKDSYPEVGTVVPHSHFGEVVLWAMALGIVLATALIILIKKDNALKDLYFSRN